MPIVGLGTDIVECSRVARLLERHPDRAVQRLFTPAEQAYCRRTARSVERFAARFAGKEAVLKALGTGWVGQISWCDMQIMPDAAGKPVLTLTGECARIAAELGVTRWQITLSHTTEYATATAIAEA